MRKLVNSLQLEEKELPKPLSLTGVGDMCSAFQM